MLLETINPSEKRMASIPHSLFNFNIILVHLFAVVILFELNLLYWFWIIPVLSLSLMFFMHRYAKRLMERTELQTKNYWYVVANWKLALKHNRIVLMAYLISGSIFLAGYTLTASTTSDANMSNIGAMIFLYISGNMLLITLVVTFVLSSGAVWHTSKGDVTKSLEKIRNSLDLPSLERKKD